MSIWHLFSYIPSHKKMTWKISIIEGIQIGILILVKSIQAERWSITQVEYLALTLFHLCLKILFSAAQTHDLSLH
jgi:uncharacterized membrane protein YjdF